MNPQFNQTPGLHLPQPTAEANRGYNPGAMNDPGVAFAPSTATPPQALQPVQTQAPVDEKTIDDAAIDGDEEWVQKAQGIVVQYKNDPYMQNRELSILRAQYIKARYNKDIKVSEDR